MPQAPHKWIYAPGVDELKKRALASDLAVPPFLAELLCHRGLDNADDAKNFLYPRLASLTDPFQLSNMAAAVDRIFAALDHRERIVLYGDYDVDGVTSLALFTRMLRAFGADPKCFLPIRGDEGYGLSLEGIDRCLNENRPQLLIAVDCGTSSISQIAMLKAKGVDVIVFDHHELRKDSQKPGDASLPDCTLVNPHLGTDFGYLCSVGIVFKACHALLKRRPVPGFDLREHLDLVALGTVADIVPLIGENRILVQKGMRQMERTKWTGLRVLMEVSGVRAPISPSDIGFRLGPRLNAAGRLGTAEAALELLLTDDSSRARTLAMQLDSQNGDRQSVERRILKEAAEKLKTDYDPGQDAAIVLGESGWHAGVLGIVASRLSRTHHRPTLIIGFDENGVGKGSGRSIEGLSLVHALSECSHLLDQFGGHEMAAGLTIQQNRFPEFQRAFRECVRKLLTDDDLQPRLRLDTEVPLMHLDFDFLEQHELLQPFGTGNPQPLFFARGVVPSGQPRVLKEKHLLLTVRQNGNPCSAIYFNGAETGLPSPPWDMAFRIERNEFRGAVSLQVQVHQLRSTE